LCKRQTTTIIQLLQSFHWVQHVVEHVAGHSSTLLLPRRITMVAGGLITDHALIYFKFKATEATHRVSCTVSALRAVYLLTICRHAQPDDDKTKNC